MSRDFYELCYDQYKHEMSEAQGLYQKAQLMLLVIPLLGAIGIRLSRVDILHLCFVRVDAFLFYLAFAVSCGALAAAVLFLFLMVYPRKYATLEGMKAWENWRKEYQEYLEKDDNNRADCEALDMAMFQNLCPKLAEAQPFNAAINEKRRIAFKHSIQMSAIAVASLSIEALLALLLKLQGV